MFTQLKNIDTAFVQIKRFCYGFLAANVLCMGLCIWKSYETVSRAQQRVFILYNGKVLAAVGADRKVNNPVEMRDHIKTFHEDFFNLSPDDHAIQASLSSAYYLADISAKREVDILREQGFYNNLIAANISQQVTVDSIRLRGEDFPYGFTCYATEQLRRATNTVYRKLVTQGELIDLRMRSDANPHGFLIRNWQVLDNSDTVKVMRP